MIFSFLKQKPIKGLALTMNMFSISLEIIFQIDNMANKTTEEMLKKILNDLKNIGGIEALAVVRRDGLLLYSTIAQKKRAEKFSAMSASMMGAAEATAAILEKGIPDWIVVESKHGRIIGTGAGPKALLMVMTGPYAGLGLFIIEVTKASEKIKQVLG